MLPKHGAKRLAQLMGVPIETARHWLYKTPAADRHGELVRRLLAEFERQEAERTRVRQRLRDAMSRLA